MRLRVVALVSITLIVVGLVAAPNAAGKSKPCKRGTVKAKVGGRATCVAKRLVLPAPAKIAPGLAQLKGALALTEVGFKTRSGKRATPLSKRVGRTSVTIGTTSNGLQLSLQTTVNGDTYTFKYDSGQSDCAKHSLPACPQADGTLDGSGTKGKVG